MPDVYTLLFNETLHTLHRVNNCSLLHYLVYCY